MGYIPIGCRGCPEARGVGSAGCKQGIFANDVWGSVKGCGLGYWHLEAGGSKPRKTVVVDVPYEGRL